MAVKYVNNTYNDRSNEKVTNAFYVDIADDGTGANAINLALDGVTAGIRHTSKIVEEYRFSNAIPSSVHANRETKALIHYEDTTTFSRHYFSVPMPNLAVLDMVSETDRFSLTDTEIAALVTAFETHGKSPAGNPVNVLYVELVGRNL